MPRHDKLASTSPNGIAAMAGFSMIEMMISITIGLVILAALAGVLASNSASTKSNDRTSELQTNGRYAMDHLKREIRQAGYRGYTWAEPNTPTTAIAVSNECLDNSAAADAFVVNIRQGIWGANDTNPFTANCLPAASRLRGDVLAIRRAASTLVTTLAANTMYFRSSYAVGEVFQGTTLVSITGTPIGTFALQEYVYYIGKDDNDATVPALRRVSMQTNAMVDEMVVSGIENMQIQYGRATTDLNTQYYNASGITGYSTDAAQTQWDDVNSVRIWLLARNATAEGGYSNTNSYVMGDVTYTVNDSFRRQLFTAVVQLRN
ncbi:MAG: prepilin-type N-terminal cleavage/methylation domain-containing protein [Nitrosomonadales bacterium]|nr:MAG: prepilin-type N-terminal cleavage/methylation domain-containing protein [Nitrosomonadales bacterium]